MEEIKSTIEARNAQIRKLRLKVDNVEDEVSGVRWRVM